MKTGIEVLKYLPTFNKKCYTVFVYNSINVSNIVLSNFWLQICIYLSVEIYKIVKDKKGNKNKQWNENKTVLEIVKFSATL